MTDNKDKRWFVVQIKPNSSNLAIRNLERQGFETFLPKLNITSRKNNKFVLKRVDLFPGYIFVLLNLKLSNWTVINSTFGVSKILCFNKKPAEISSELVLALKMKYNSNRTDLKNTDLQKGDLIKIYNGAFAEFFATVENLDENNRVWLLLENAGKRQKLRLNKSSSVNFIKV